MRILIIEDNARLARQLKTTLEQSLYAVDMSFDGEEGLHMGESQHYDAVILDLGLPSLDGLEVLKMWREEGNASPVLILTSRTNWREIVAGLRAGADDYLSKPFQFEELLARLEALIRRATGHASPILGTESGRVRMDTSSARVVFDGVLIDLTALEYRTLEYLMLHEDEVISKSELTEHIYDQDFDRDSNVIEVLINRLRGKLTPELIVTRRGLGYQLTNHAAGP